VATDFGGPEVLSVVDEPEREPSGSEVRIRVHAAGVNPWDFKSYSPAMAGGTLPVRLGAEASGVVDAVGTDVDGVSVGDEVIAYRAPGAYTDALLVPESAVMPKPSELSWEEAAGLMLTGVTAVHALTAADVGAGETLLIHAAAGGVGLMAVQLAVARGARVIGTASERNHELLTALGAIPVSYGRGLAERVRAIAPHGIDAAVDLVGSDEAVDASLELVRPAGRVVSAVAMHRREDGITLIGGGPGADPGIEIRTAAGGGGGDRGTESRNAAAALIVELARAGTIRVFVERTYPMTAAAEAHRALQQGHTVGKLVLTVG
jgi:NADPH:quinone reductase-like Zn-dependent oxidoreductase